MKQDEGEVNSRGGWSFDHFYLLSVGRFIFRASEHCLIQDSVFFLSCHVCLKSNSSIIQVFFFHALIFLSGLSNMVLVSLISLS